MEDIEETHSQYVSKNKEINLTSNSYSKGLNVQKSKNYRCVTEPVKRFNRLCTNDLIQLKPSISRINRGKFYNFTKLS